VCSDIIGQSGYWYMYVLITVVVNCIVIVCAALLNTLLVNRDVICIFVCIVEKMHTVIGLNQIKIFLLFCHVGLEDHWK